MPAGGVHTEGVLIGAPEPLLGKVNAIYSGRSRRHLVENYPGPLSIKSMAHGAAVWQTDDGAQRVHASSFLILNEGTKYSLVIDSPEPVRTFVLFFRHGFVEEIHRSLMASPKTLLDAPFEPAARATFAEVIHPALESGIGPALDRIRRLWQTGADGLTLEDEFRDVAVRLLRLRHLTSRMLASAPALKPATKLELYRRTQKARVMIEDSFRQNLRLEEIAREACLSPFHFHRSFQRICGVTPHQYLLGLRLREAARLLESTDYPVALVCAKTGFESVPSFSSLFRRRFRMSPGRFRAARQNSNFR